MLNKDIYKLFKFLHVFNADNIINCHFEEEEDFLFNKTKKSKTKLQRKV